jgi:hypothetical protein
MRRDSMHVIRVQEEVALRALYGVEECEERDGEHEHRHRIRLPVLLLPRVDANNPVEGTLEPGECAARGEAGVGVDARHVHAERIAECHEHGAVDDDLRNSLRRH